ncbi:rhamnogalacturonan lyase [Flavobacterium zepuense]|uniref:Rhamnogalacturonan lyase n=2 Tax=Flavobacterium zepuense TaxID=2593302 RepID=A0A552V0M2_9FLAO|nr:rhamnogalacturonan lyase [Flavobacterium zepuense]
MEYLNRGVAATTSSSGIFVSWRLLGSEDSNTAFNVYRKTNGKEVKLNTKPLTKGTNFLDTTADKNQVNTYSVKALSGKKELPANGSFTLKKGQLPYLSVPLQTPEGYSPNDASVADLDGDGEYEIVLHQTGKAHDNSHDGPTDEPIFQAYKLDGTLMWTINLGKNIREGAHYTQFIVYDLDGDGKAEVAMKTADGTKDGKGKIIGDASKDYRNATGHILSGPEYLTVFDGLTGAEVHTVKYAVPRYSGTDDPTEEQLKEVWGDGNGNRSDRYLAAAAYLDGKTPSLIMCRGYYTRTAIAAWDFKNKKLSLRWLFDSDSSEENRKYRGQGNHNLSITDVDNDGKDEIVYGAMTIDDNGTGLNSTGFGHGDALHVGDLDPTHPGIEIFDIQERFDDAGMHFRDGATGEVLWKKPSLTKVDKGQGPGRGLALNIDPRYPGSECWALNAGMSGMYDAKGNRISEKAPSCNFGIYWDGDLLSELLNGTVIDKWDYTTESTTVLLDTKDFDCVSNNGTKMNPVLSADIFGDWREEVIYRTTDNKELRIFTTNIPTDHRLYTLMHNPQYRLSIAWQNVAYNQPPHTSFYMDETMPQQQKPNITIKKK